MCLKKADHKLGHSVIGQCGSNYISNAAKLSYFSLLSEWVVINSSRGQKCSIEHFKLRNKVFCSLCGNLEVQVHEIGDEHVDSLMPMYSCLLADIFQHKP